MKVVTDNAIDLITLGISGRDYIEGEKICCASPFFPSESYTAIPRMTIFEDDIIKLTDARNLA